MRPDYSRQYQPPEPEYPINPWLLGVGVFFVAMILLNIFFGLPPVCRDGWHSSSIGSRGACSHHGGVVSQNGWIFWVSAVIGVAAVFLMDARAKAVARAKEFVRLKRFDDFPVPEGYDAKEYRDLLAVGFSDLETQKIIAARRPKKASDREARPETKRDS